MLELFTKARCDAPDEDDKPKKGQPQAACVVMESESEEY